MACSSIRSDMFSYRRTVTLPGTFYTSAFIFGFNTYHCASAVALLARTLKMTINKTLAVASVSLIAYQVKHNYRGQTKRQELLQLPFFVALVLPKKGICIFNGI